MAVFPTLSEVFKKSFGYGAKLQNQISKNTHTDCHLSVNLAKLYNEK